MKPGASSERAVILAPTGRDAFIAAALIKEAGYFADVCVDLAALMHQIESGAGRASSNIGESSFAVATTMRPSPQAA